VKIVRLYDRDVHECEICFAKVNELRRGRCWGCYARWTESRPVGLGARCTCCNEKRRRLLKSVELLGGWRPLCFNCAGQVALLEPVPRTITAIKDAISRERRKKDRRVGRPDTRVFQYERRIGERRDTARDAYTNIDDEMIIEITVEPEVTAGGEDFDDLTQIRALVAELRPVDLAV